MYDEKHNSHFLKGESPGKEKFLNIFVAGGINYPYDLARIDLFV